MIFTVVKGKKSEFDADETYLRQVIDNSNALMLLRQSSPPTSNQSKWETMTVAIPMNLKSNKI
jgi:hypothetical protein